MLPDVGIVKRRLERGLTVWLFLFLAPTRTRSAPGERQTGLFALSARTAGPTG
jgi:hypothetical protein